MALSVCSSPLRTGLIVYGAVACTCFALNVRWQYIGDYLFRRNPRSLPITKVEAKKKNKKGNGNIIIVLLHGMWHDATWFSKLQHLLQERGYTSYAIDLLPGERFLVGFSQKEIVADLENTLLKRKEDDDEDYDETAQFVLLGHSQGGLVVQSCLKNSPKLQARTIGAVLMGSFPLGLIPPVRALLRQPRNMYRHWGYAGILCAGKIWSLDYLKYIFLLPSTDPSTLPEYTSKLLEAPSDGWITMTHFPQRVGVISQIPTLVLGAEQDIIYPPHLLKKDFDNRFPNASQKVIPKQAHCFMDATAWDTSTEDAILEWLDAITVV